MYSTQHYHTLPQNTLQYTTVQYSTIQYSTIQYNTIQYNTIHYHTIQYNNTIQYNTIQQNTLHLHYNILPTVTCTAYYISWTDIINFRFQPLFSKGCTYTFVYTFIANSSLQKMNLVSSHLLFYDFMTADVILNFCVFDYILM